ncbi:MAG: signal peptidase II [candidate division WS1 bacterium]|nr:signal peptidase II [candidate division WS1 bacterium]
MSEAQACGGRAARRFLALALVVALADQGLKLLIVSRMAAGESRPLLGSVLSLTRQSNPGAAFGLFSGAGVVLTAVGAALVALLLIWGLRSAGKDAEFLWPVALLLGGALGNLIDRLFRGRVVDYLDLHFWPVFNLADVALTVGVFWFALRLLLSPEGRGQARLSPPGDSR